MPTHHTSHDNPNHNNQNPNQNFSGTSIIPTIANSSVCYSNNSVNTNFTASLPKHKVPNILNNRFNVRPRRAKSYDVPYSYSPQKSNITNGDQAGVNKLNSVVFSTQRSANLVPNSLVEPNRNVLPVTKEKRCSEIISASSDNSSIKPRKSIPFKEGCHSFSVNLNLKPKPTSGVFASIDKQSSLPRQQTATNPGLVDDSAISTCSIFTGQKLDENRDIMSQLYEELVSLNETPPLFAKYSRRLDHSKLELPTLETKQSESIRNELSINDKLKLLILIKQGIPVTTLSQKYNVDPSTIYGFIRQESKLIDFCKSNIFNDSRKRIKKPDYELVDFCMDIWFKQVRALGIPSSGPLIQAKAKWFHAMSGSTKDFKASTGWLRAFKTRHGIHKMRLTGEKMTADLRAASDYTNFILPTFFNHGYNLDQIYNADETAIYWHALPNATLASSAELSADGFKPERKRITLLVCANATGNHKLELLTIGKSRKPNSFKEFHDNQIINPNIYFNNSNACMVREIFATWFEEHFVPEVIEYQRKQGIFGNVMLIVDSASCHSNIPTIMRSGYTYTVSYLPKNVTSLIQPMDQGVIATMKHYYRHNLLCDLVIEKNTQDILSYYNHYTLFHAMLNFHKAWTKVPGATIANCWRKTFPLLGKAANIPIHDSIDDVLNLVQRIPGFQYYSIKDIINWENAELDLQGIEALHDEDILISALKKTNLASNYLGPVKTEEDLKALKIVLDIYKSKPEVNTVVISALNDEIAFLEKNL